MAHYGLESDLLSLRIYNPSTEEVEDTRHNEELSKMTNAFMWDPSGEKKFILNTVLEGIIVLFSFDFDGNEYVQMIMLMVYLY